MLRWLFLRVIRNPKTKMVFEILMAWENEWRKNSQFFPETYPRGSTGVEQLFD